MFFLKKQKHTGCRRYEAVVIITFFDSTSKCFKNVQKILYLPLPYRNPMTFQAYLLFCIHQQNRLFLCLQLFTSQKSLNDFVVDCRYNLKHIRVLPPCKMNQQASLTPLKQTGQRYDLQGEFITTLLLTAQPQITYMF